MRQISILLGLLVLALACGIAWWFLGQQGDGGAASAGGGPGYTLTASDRALGNPKAKVVLIEYAAPTCPVCAHFNSDTLPQIKTDYIDTGKVYYVFRLFPLRSDDGAAEKIARCLPEDKYFPFIDLLFRNQPKWDVEYSQENPALATPQGVHDGLVLLGRIAGMSADKADQCMKDTALDSSINQVAQDGGQKYNITGTPTIVVDGVAQPSGFIAYDALKKIIDTALAKK
ncbi:MAG TPA: thioredoxin domain-containing protein [Rhizomicrobium sp.]|nr:thioredoxin domain-containing protein [Rhizomicrobium sp.]